MRDDDRATAEAAQLPDEFAQLRLAPNHPVVDPMDGRDERRDCPARVDERLERRNDFARFNDLASDLDHRALIGVDPGRLHVDEGETPVTDRFGGHEPQYPVAECHLGGILRVCRLVGGTFRSLSGFNYRIWAAGALVSNIGSWMQRTAQDWLVLTGLTHNNATALGVVIALQFGPQVLLLPVTGFVADHFSRRKLLILTQVAMGALALGLGLLTIAGHVQLWHVYVFAFLLGCVTAFDAPVRQTFVPELVGEDDLPNAVGLNSASFNVARMVGPAVAGVLIGIVGSGMLFLINAASFAAVIVSLYLLRPGDLHLNARAARKPGSLAEGFGYVWKRPDLKDIHIMFFLIGTFCLNFTIFISTMAVSAFHVGASQYGILTAMMAFGSIGGALVAAGRIKPHAAAFFIAATILGVGFAIAAFMPNYWLFGLVLLVIGASSQNFNTTSISTVQLTTEPAMRGRVMAILLAMAMGGAPIGAPILGWVADVFGPRWSLGVGAIAAFGAAAVGIAYAANVRRTAARLIAG